MPGNGWLPAWQYWQWLPDKAEGPCPPAGLAALVLQIAMAATSMPVFACAACGKTMLAKMPNKASRAKNRRSWSDMAAGL